MSMSRNHIRTRNTSKGSNHNWQKIVKKYDRYEEQESRRKVAKLVEKFNQKWDFEQDWRYYDQLVEEQKALDQWEIEHQYDDYWYDIDADYDQAWQDYLEDQKYRFEDPVQDYNPEQLYELFLQQLNYKVKILAIKECQVDIIEGHLRLASYANFCHECGEKLK